MLLAVPRPVRDAIYDWIGRRLGLPVYRLLGLDPTTTPPTSMTIGIDEPDVLKRKVAEAGRAGREELEPDSFQAISKDLIERAGVVPGDDPAKR